MIGVQIVRCYLQGRRLLAVWLVGELWMSRGHSGGVYLSLWGWRVGACFVFVYPRGWRFPLAGLVVIFLFSYVCMLGAADSVSVDRMSCGGWETVPLVHFRCRIVHARGADY